VAVATVVVVLTANAMPAAAGPSRLLPDLITMRLSQDDLVLDASANKLLLRLSNEIANRGRGPLELFASGVSHNCDRDGDPANDRDAFQRIFLDTNGDHVFERGVDNASTRKRVGCEQYHPAHHHWHLLDFSRYTLKRERTGKTVARSTKIGFCIIDTDHAFPGTPGSPPDPGYYPAGTPDCTETSIDGISVGWADIYRYGLPGQEINVTGLARGRYCLISKADPDNLLEESDNSNNARRTPIGLHPAKRTVVRLHGHCGR
jgi:Lysyl oxidase